MGKTGIQWTDESDNVSAGCTRVPKPNGQSGCDECYAFTLHDRRHVAYKKGRWPDAPAQYHWPFSASYKRPGESEPQGVQLLPERLNRLLTLKAPRKIFLGSMTDMFHETMPFDYLVQVWGVLAATPHITYQILTKRPARMREFLTTVDQDAIKVAGAHRIAMLPAITRKRVLSGLARVWQWPLPNVWLGTSVEDQMAAEMRLDDLLLTPAAIHYISGEPMIGGVNLRPWLWEAAGPEWAGYNLAEPGLDWVIIGGESGDRARPMELAWVESLIEQCREAGVAVFVKQLGSVWAKEYKAQHNHGGEPDEWPEHLRIREFPTPAREAVEA